MCDCVSQVEAFSIPYGSLIFDYSREPVIVNSNSCRTLKGVMKVHCATRGHKCNQNSYSVSMSKYLIQITIRIRRLIRCLAKRHERSFWRFWRILEKKIGRNCRLSGNAINSRRNLSVKFRPSLTN